MSSGIRSTLLRSNRSIAEAELDGVKSCCRRTADIRRLVSQSRIVVGATPSAPRDHPGASCSSNAHTVDN